MKYSFVFVLSIFLASHTLADSKALRRVELEWEEQRDAKAYELEVYTNEDELVLTKGFKTNAFVFEVPTGKYMIRSRPFDRRRVSGPWSEKMELEVPPKKIEMAALKSSRVTASENTLEGEFDFTWPTAEGAIDYVLVIYSSPNLIVKKLYLTDAKAHISLPPGKYEVEMTPRGEDEVLGEPCKRLTVEVAGAALKDLKIAEFDANQPTEFKWESPNKSVLYSGKLERKDLWAPNDPWEEMDAFDDIAETKIKYDEPLEPGLYRLSVRSKAAGWMDSKMTTREFVIKPQKRELTSVPDETAVPFDFAKISD